MQDLYKDWSLPNDSLRVPSTHAIAPNVLNRTFGVVSANRKWVADFTYLWTAEGWLNVAAGHGSLFATRGRLVHECDHDRVARHRCARDGDLAAREAPTVLHHSDRGRPVRTRRSVSACAKQMICGCFRWFRP